MNTTLTPQPMMGMICYDNDDDDDDDDDMIQWWW